MLRLWNNVTGRGQAPAGSGRVSALVCAGMVLALGIAPSAQALQSPWWTVSPPAADGRNGFNAPAYQATFKWSSPLPWSLNVSKCNHNSDFEYRFGAIKLSLIDNSEFLAIKNGNTKCLDYDWHVQKDFRSYCFNARWTSVLSPACAQHEFAYNNLGGRDGGKFAPKNGVAPWENFRAMADFHFLRNMRLLCDRVTLGKVECQSTAYLIYQGVRETGGRVMFDNTNGDLSGNLTARGLSKEPQFIGTPRQFDIEKGKDGETWIVQVQTDGSLLTRTVRRGSTRWSSFVHDRAGTWAGSDMEIGPSGEVWLLGRQWTGAVLIRQKTYNPSSVSSGWTGWFPQGIPNGWKRADITVASNGDLWFAGLSKYPYGVHWRSKKANASIGVGWSSYSSRTSSSDIYNNVDVKVLNNIAYILYNNGNSVRASTVDNNHNPPKYRDWSVTYDYAEHFKGNIIAGDNRLWVTISDELAPTLAAPFNLTGNTSFSGRWAVPTPGIFWAPSVPD